MTLDFSVVVFEMGKGGCIEKRREEKRGIWGWKGFSIDLRKRYGIFLAKLNNGNLGNLLILIKVIILKGVYIPTNVF